MYIPSFDPAFDPLLLDHLGLDDFLALKPSTDVAPSGHYAPDVCAPQSRKRSRADEDADALRVALADRDARLAATSERLRVSDLQVDELGAEVRRLEARFEARFKDEKRTKRSSASEQNFKSYEDAFRDTVDRLNKKNIQLEGRLFDAEAKIARLKATLLGQQASSGTRTVGGSSESDICVSPYHLAAG